MTTTRRRAEDATVASARRAEIEARMAELGFRLGPRRVRTRRAAAAEPAAVRLRLLFEGLGPVFGAYARELATRLDLLPAAVCGELARLPERSPATPFERVSARIGASLEGRPWASFLQIEPLPYASGLLTQSHRGALASGEAVAVVVVHPESERAATVDLELLATVDPALRECGAVPELLEPVRSELRLALAEALDLRRLADHLEEIGGGAIGSAALGAVTVHRALSGPGVLTRAVAAGRPLAERAGSASPAAGEIARELCSGWLRQALDGRPFPVSWRDGDLVADADGAVRLCGGAFARLSESSRRSVLELMMGASSHQPEAVLAALAREAGGMPLGAEVELRRRFRQAVPFRDGGADSADDLAGYLLLYWRIGAEHGMVLPPPLNRFFQGLAALSAVARALAPDRDPLREALEAMRLESGVNELRRLLVRPLSAGEAGGYAEALLALPQRLDAVLARLEEGELPVRLQVVEAPERRRQKNRGATRAALALAATGALLVGLRAVPPELGSLWIEGLGAVVLLAVGGILLRTIASGS